MTQRPMIDHEIADLLGSKDTATDAERGKCIALEQLDDAITRTPLRSRRRRTPRHARLAIGLAIALVLMSGVAVAASTDLASRILGSKKPAAERIEAIRTDPRPDMTQEQLIDGFRAAFVKEQIGDRLDAVLSAPLVQDERARLSARRTADGNVCMALFIHVAYEPDKPASWQQGSAMCGAFEDGWPLMDSIRSSSDTGTMSYGLVADGVAQVRFLVDGTARDAIMGDGGFLWRHPEGANPSDIEVVLDDGTVVRRDLTWMGKGRQTVGRPSPPHVVGP